MQSLSRAFRANCLFALFYELESDAFISVLRRNQLFVSPNNYFFCALRDDSAYGLSHLSFSVTVSFAFCHNAVVSDFRRFGQFSRIPRHKSNRLAVQSRNESVFFGDLQIVVKKVVELFPLILPIMRELRLEGISVFQQSRERSLRKLRNFSKLNIHVLSNYFHDLCGSGCNVIRAGFRKFRPVAVAVKHAHRF